MDKDNREIVVGIDLGTTNSCIAYVPKGSEEPEVIPNIAGDRTTPSVVLIKKDGSIVVGTAAKKRAIIDASRTISSVKTHAGEVDFQVEIDGKIYKQEQIAAYILSDLKKSAETFLGKTINRAVVTIPAYFNESQRQATISAGKIAGLEIIRLVNEPTAAALAYRIDKEGRRQNLLVFDLGGGTLDISILKVDSDILEVIATTGENKLGGDDFDNRIVDYLADKFLKENKIDLRKLPNPSERANAMQRLKQAAEEEKKNLSSSLDGTINLPFIHGSLHIEEKITRAKFESLVSDLIKKCEQKIIEALKDAKLSNSEIDKVILVGGSTRIPSVQKSIQNIFPDKELTRSRSPDEVVAEGAAIQASSLTGGSKSILLIDTTPLNLGIEVASGELVPIILRNTTIPATATKQFTTYEDYQTAVTIAIYQGNRPMAKDNKMLGSFNLSGLRPARAGETKIDVTFDLNADGILEVTAIDSATGNKAKTSVTNQNLSKDEIEKMRKDAEENEVKDRERIRKSQILNSLDRVISEMRKHLSDVKDEALKTEVEKAISEIEAKREEQSIEVLQASIDRLNGYWDRIEAAKKTKDSDSSKEENKNSKDSTDSNSTEGNTEENSK